MAQGDHRWLITCRISQDRMDLSVRAVRRTTCARSAANDSLRKVSSFLMLVTVLHNATLYSLTVTGNLKTHIRSVHTKEKPFSCPVCGKSFSQKGNMQTHVRTHNKDDRFPCNLCGKTFSQKGKSKFA